MQIESILLGAVRGESLPELSAEQVKEAGIAATSSWIAQGFAPLREHSRSKVLAAVLQWDLSGEVLSLVSRDPGLGSFETFSRFLAQEELSLEQVVQAVATITRMSGPTSSGARRAAKGDKRCQVVLALWETKSLHTSVELVKVAEQSELMGPRAELWAQLVRDEGGVSSERLWELGDLASRT